MLAPMVILAALTLGIGLASVALLPVLDRIIMILAPGHGVSLGAPLATVLGRDLHLLLIMEGLLLAVGGLALVWLSRRAPGPTLVAPPTWDCGYAAPTSRMQYTGSSFADGWSGLLPGVSHQVKKVRGLFPRARTFRSEIHDLVGWGLVEPWFGRLGERLLRFHRLQRGFLSIYILYVLLTLLGVFLWLLLRARVLA
jgi:hypothetical protein